MKAEDLFPGAIVTVADLEDTLYLEVLELHYISAYLFCSETNGGGLYDKRDIRPIPLTPEILTEWFGFEVTKGGIIEKWHTRDLLGETYKRPICLEHWKGGHFDLRAFTTTFCTIQYVHELQRTWHVLTGQPLKRKGSGK